MPLRPNQEIVVNVQCRLHSSHTTHKAGYGIACRRGSEEGGITAADAEIERLLTPAPVPRRHVRRQDPRPEVRKADHPWVRCRRFSWRNDKVQPYTCRSSIRPEAAGPPAPPPAIGLEGPRYSPIAARARMDNDVTSRSTPRARTMLPGRRSSRTRRSAPCTARAGTGTVALVLTKKSTASRLASRPFPGCLPQLTRWPRLREQRVPPSPAPAAVDILGPLAAAASSRFLLVGACATIP